MSDTQGASPEQPIQDGFRLTQTFDVPQPQSTKAMVIQKSEWTALLTSVSKIKDSNSIFHTIGSALIGAGISTGAAALFTPFTVEQSTDKVIMWAIAISCTFCGVISCFFAEKEKALVAENAANVLAQMKIIESRFQNDS